MKFPNTIPKFVRSVYETSDEARLKLCQGKGRIFSDVFESDYGSVHNLKEICLHTISKYFDILSPISFLSEHDFKYLVNILSTNLHLKYIINIQDEIYWERCFVEKYPGKNIIQKNYAGFWKKEYLKKYLQSLIEDADLNNIAEIIELSKISSPYVNSLILTSIKLIENFDSIKQLRFDDEDLNCKSIEIKFREEISPNHCSLDEILQNLINLKELCLEFSLNNLAEYRNEMLFKLSILDCELICRGLSSLENFRMLKVNSCYIDRARAEVFSKFILHNKNMESIDFSYCVMCDDAVKYFSKIIYHENIKKIILCHNEFGDEGMKAISYCISKKILGCIEILDLGMNLISDIGASYLASAIVRSNGKLTSLILRGCSIKNDGAIKISGALKYNRSLDTLDIAVNDFSNAENILLESLRENPTLKTIEARDSGLSECALVEIREILNFNKLRKVSVPELCIAPLYLNEPDYYIWDHDPDNPGHASGLYPERISEM